MSGDYETLEINQPKIFYLRKDQKIITLWLDEMINNIEEMISRGSPTSNSLIMIV